MRDILVLLDYLRGKRMKEKYGYLGPKGTFSEIAVLKYSKKDDELIYFKSIKEIIDKLKKGKIDLGLIPLENSLEGSVNYSLDILYKENLWITGEIIIPVKQYLLVPDGLRIDQIKNIYSHPQAIAQSEELIHKYLENAKIVYTESTAAAAQMLKNDIDAAMLGSKRIIDLYGYKVLAEQLDENFTRFIIVSDKKRGITKYERQKEYKSSLIISPNENKPGILYKILGEFAEKNIDLTRIESRPTKKLLGEYLFYLDIAGHIDEPDISNAIKNLEKNSSYFKILGTYIKDILKEGSIAKNVKSKNGWKLV